MEFKKSDFENLSRCPWCDFGTYSMWGRKLRGFISVKCDECGLIFIKNRLNKNGLEKFYKNYLKEVHQADDKLNKQRSEMYELEFELVNRYSKKTDVLDVGCSGGYFLDLFKRHGYECYGVEIGEAAAQEASKKHKVYKGDFPEINIKRKFDLIVFRGVIEHVPYPRTYLDKAVSLLNNQGLIYITSTPNSDAFCARLFKENWNQHVPEEHLMHFSPRHFDEYFKGQGFIKIIQHHFYEESPYANLCHDILEVAKALKLVKENKKVIFKSPAFWGNMMSLIYGAPRFYGTPRGVSHCGSRAPHQSKLGAGVVPFSARRAESPEAKRRNNSSVSLARYAFCINPPRPFSPCSVSSQ